MLTLYVDKLLCTPLRVLARMVDTLACRRVEMLLAANLQVLKKTLLLVFIGNFLGQAEHLAFSSMGIFFIWPPGEIFISQSFLGVSDAGARVLFFQPAFATLSRVHRFTPSKCWIRFVLQAH